MALPLPTLTWAQSAIEVPVGSPTPSNEQILDAIETRVAASTYWRVITTTTLDAGSDYYLEIAPKAASATPGTRVLLYCGTPTAGSIRTPDTAEEALWVSLHIGGETLSDPDPGNYTGAYANSGRWSGYWKLARSLSSNAPEQIWIIESDEAIAIVGIDNSASKEYIAILGAIVEGFDAGSVESDDRIYGIVTGDPDGGSAIQGVTAILDHSTSNNAQHCGGWLPTDESTWHNWNRVYVSAETGATDSFQTLGSGLAFVPQFLKQVTVTPRYIVGVLRQIRYTEDFKIRAVISEGGADKAFIYTPTDTPTAGDALAFTND